MERHHSYDIEEDNVQSIVPPSGRAHSKLASDYIRAMPPHGQMYGTVQFGDPGCESIMPTEQRHAGNYFNYAQRTPQPTSPISGHSQLSCKSARNVPAPSQFNSQNRNNETFSKGNFNPLPLQRNVQTNRKRPMYEEADGDLVSITSFTSYRSTADVFHKEWDSKPEETFAKCLPAPNRFSEVPSIPRGQQMVSRGASRSQGIPDDVGVFPSVVSLTASEQRYNSQRCDATLSTELENLRINDHRTGIDTGPLNNLNINSGIKSTSQQQRLRGRCAFADSSQIHEDPVDKFTGQSFGFNRPPQTSINNFNPLSVHKDRVMKSNTTKSELLSPFGGTTDARHDSDTDVLRVVPSQTSQPNSVDRDVISLKTKNVTDIHDNRDALINSRNDQETILLRPYKATNSNFDTTSGIQQLSMYDERESTLRYTNESDKTYLNKWNNLSSTNEDVTFPKLCKDVDRFFQPDVDGDNIIAIALINKKHSFVFAILKIVDNSELLDIPNKDGNTILHLATILNQADIVRRLIALGANVTSQNIKGNTSLHIACIKGYLDCAKALTTPLQPCDTKDRQYNVQYQRIPQLQGILNYDGYSCLHLSAKHSSPDHVTIIDHLIYECDADINIKDGTSGMTILHYASIDNNISLVNFLMGIRGIDLNARRFDNSTPLALARGRNNIEVKHLLEIAGAIDMDNEHYHDYDNDNESDWSMGNSDVWGPFTHHMTTTDTSAYDDIQIDGFYLDG